MRGCPPCVGENPMTIVDEPDVIGGYIEEGVTLEWYDTGDEIVVESVAIDEDSKVWVYITDEREGYDDESVAARNLIDLIQREDDGIVYVG